MRFTKKKVTAVVTAVSVLALSVAAFAYFTTTGSGSGSASVGTSTNFNVAVSSNTAGALYPGAGSETLTYTVTNPSSGHQNLGAVAASVPADANGDILTGSPAAPVAGCKAAWFTAVASSTNALPQDLAGSGTSSGTVLVTMQNVNASQDDCKSVSPKITVDAS